MKFIICDDDASVHQIYAIELNNICRKCNIKCEITGYKDGKEMLVYLENTPDFKGILILDIYMPGLNGIALAEKIRQLGIREKIIFLTGSDQHYISAFDAEAFNYVLKNDKSHNRFKDVITKAIRKSLEEEEEHILFNNVKESRTIAIKDIWYFEVYKRIITVHYNNEGFEFFSTIAKLENQLESKGFIRTHRSYLVPVFNIESLSYSELKLRNGEFLPIGRHYRQQVSDTFNDYYGIRANNS